MSVYVCLECGAELYEETVVEHFDTEHRGEDGTPLWEHGGAEKLEGQGAD